MRICSFLPSATEIVYALGLGGSLSGVTYECDYPPEARQKTVVVNTALAHSSNSAEIDRQVSEFMGRGESLYQIDLKALQRIQPDLIITQDLCRVCAASPGDLGHALTTLARAPQVLSLNPRNLADVWNDIRTVGEATGRGDEARALVRELERRVAAVERAVSSARERPRVLCLEWLDPPFVGGHWVPEMVGRAGGTDVLGRTGEPGFRVTWQQVLATKPDVIVAMPCGFNLERTLEEFKTVPFPGLGGISGRATRSGLRGGRLELLLPPRTAPGHRRRDPGARHPPRACPRRSPRRCSTAFGLERTRVLLPRSGARLESRPPEGKPRRRRLQPLTRSVAGPWAPRARSAARDDEVLDLARCKFPSVEFIPAKQHSAEQQTAHE